MNNNNSNSNNDNNNNNIDNDNNNNNRVLYYDCALSSLLLYRRAEVGSMALATMGELALAEARSV